MSALKDKLEQQGESKLSDREKDLADKVGVGQDEGQSQSQSSDSSPQEPQAPTTPGASQSQS